MNVRNAVCDRDEESARCTGTVGRPVEPWAEVVERGLKQRNGGSGGKTGWYGGESGDADGGAQVSSRETGGSGGRAVALDGGTVDSGFWTDSPELGRI